MSKKRNFINEPLLNIKYSNKNTIKKLFKGWSNLEKLSEKGDAVAICILMDLKNVTGINPNNLYNIDAGIERFNNDWENGILTYKQFISIVYTLILGYNQSEVAQLLKIDQSGLSRHINSGLKIIATKLGE